MPATITLPKRKKKETTCKPKTCPQCGGIECFERPRYFCGQLLTDKDLDAAQRYVIEKNKLHNRYLVGTGVVCGLAVRCDPCDPCKVTVEPGYAIDCCGNDIVLCAPAEFNVCEYLDACRSQEDPCNGRISQPRSNRQKLPPQEHCLILSYAEEPARPVTALIRNNGCANTRCEPSRTREIFRFDLIEKKDYPSPPSLSDKLQDCVEVWKKFSLFLQQIKQLSPTDTEAIAKIFNEIKAYVLALYQTGPNVRCNLAAEIQKIEVGFGAAAAPYTALFSMLAFVLQFILDCFCDALLTPCAECKEPEGVLLACVTVRDDKVEKICNIARRQVITGPALRYWLQPFLARLGDAFERLCCEVDLAGALMNRLQPQKSQFNSFYFARNERAFEMASGFSANRWSESIVSDFMEFFNPNALTALDVYNHTWDDDKMRSMIREKGVENIVVKRAATDAEAYSLMNLVNMSWVVPPRSRVEVITSREGLVTSIRVLDGENQ